MSSSRDILRQLDESPLSSFHWKTVITSGMGFFTDAYDLFIIGVVIADLAPDLWRSQIFGSPLSEGERGQANSAKDLDT